MKIQSRYQLLCTLSISASLFAMIPMTASAAAIAWTSGDITADTDVSTNGTLVFAINGSTANGTTDTVNGVPFVSSTRANSATESLAQSPGSESITTTINNDNGSSFGTAGLGGLNTMGELIKGGWWGSPVGNLASITLSGLTISQVYEIQLFTNDARTNRSSVFEMTLTNGVTTAEAARLQLNNSPDNSNSGAAEAGDWGIGTFTADAATQSFDMAGFNPGASGGRIQIQAIQLRAVPEPASSLLLGLGALALIARRRR